MQYLVVVASMSTHVKSLFYENELKILDCVVTYLFKLCNKAQCKITEILLVTFETAFKKDLILAKHPVRNVKRIHNCCFYFNNEIVNFTYFEELLLF